MCHLFGLSAQALVTILKPLCTLSCTSERNPVQYTWVASVAALRFIASDQWVGAVNDLRIRHNKHTTTAYMFI